MWYLVRHGEQKDLDNNIRKKLGIPVSEEPLPDVLSGQFEKPDGKSNLLWAPKNAEPDTADYNSFFSYTPLSVNPGWVSYKFHYSVSGLERKEPEQDSSPFEVDMAEALTGWRVWKIERREKAIQSQNLYSLKGKRLDVWQPEIPMVAECGTGWNHSVPSEFCTCGVYAKDNLNILEDSFNYSGIYGQCYGWGRYVRGDKGWRAQYAYPKNFYLTRNYAREVSPDTIDILKQYHVPIYVEQPMLFYNPKEDGYEYREDEENWNFGADSNPNAEED